MVFIGSLCGQFSCPADNPMLVESDPSSPRSTKIAMFVEQLGYGKDGEIMCGSLGAMIMPKDLETTLRVELFAPFFSAG